MGLDEAIKRSRRRRAYSPSTLAYVCALGNSDVLFVDASSYMGDRPPRISDLKPISDLGEAFVAMLYAQDDWIPESPKSPHELLAECAKGSE